MQPTSLPMTNFQITTDSAQTPSRTTLRDVWAAFLHKLWNHSDAAREMDTLPWRGIL